MASAEDRGEASGEGTQAQEVEEKGEEKKCRSKVLRWLKEQDKRIEIIGRSGRLEILEEKTICFKF
jgi:hypothetical protein